MLLIVYYKFIDHQTDMQLVTVMAFSLFFSFSTSHSAFAVTYLLLIILPFDLVTEYTYHY